MEEDRNMEGYVGEQRRILGLVADGRVTVEDGDRLLAALDPQLARVRCPYCAEEIVAGLEDCPECGSRLGGVRDGRVVGQGVFASMTTLGKGLVVYMAMVCALVILTGFSGLWGPSPLVAASRLILAGLGVAAVVCICRGQRLGWGLAMCWSALQILEIHVHHAALNHQVLSFSFSVVSNGAGFGINLVGIVLLLLTYRAWVQAAPPPERS